MMSGINLLSLPTLPASYHKTSALKTKTKDHYDTLMFECTKEFKGKVYLRKKSKKKAFWSHFVFFIHHLPCQKKAKTKCVEVHYAISLALYLYRNMWTPHYHTGSNQMNQLAIFSVPVNASRVSALRLGGCGFDPWLGHTKDYKNGTHCLIAWYQGLAGLGLNLMLLISTINN